jgi:hypothetical protein
MQAAASRRLSGCARSRCRRWRWCCPATRHVARLSQRQQQQRSRRNNYSLVQFHPILPSLQVKNRPVVPPTRRFNVATPCPPLASAPHAFPALSLAAPHAYRSLEGLYPPPIMPHSSPKLNLSSFSSVHFVASSIFSRNPGAYHPSPLLSSPRLSIGQPLLPFPSFLNTFIFQLLSHALDLSSGPHLPPSQAINTVSSLRVVTVMSRAVQAVLDLACDWVRLLLICRSIETDA